MLSLTERHSEKQVVVYADADDPGLRFILPGPDELGGLVRNTDQGHLGTIVGRGGSGKSILALQLVTALLNSKPNPRPDQPHGAFYFTLEASPHELSQQVSQFRWGERYGDWKEDTERVSAYDAFSNGLYLLSIPSPVESLNTLNLQIRQTIARQLRLINGLAAIVVDPMGAVNATDDLRTSLSQLKELAERHRTFVFLLTEKYVFEKHTSIEHYSQSIIHLEHDPGQQPHRRLYVQKARGQGFRSGYHQFELQQARTSEEGDQKGSVSKSLNDSTKTSPTDPSPSSATEGISKGIRVFPSIEAQSAYAHELLSASQRFRSQPSANLVPFFPNEDDLPFLPDEGGIEEGSAVFLMGPPGTFKEWVAGKFAEAAGEHGATIYLSFKADFQTIRQSQAEAESFDSRKDVPTDLKATTYFFDARSPLLTPEEVLFTVQNAIIQATTGAVTFRRAIIWGLRRLYDFPNFREGRVVQFLEALVTLLKSRQITSLLVDWPDKLTPSTVPIVDLCQYIFLSRVCFSPESPQGKKSAIRRGLKRLWDKDTKRVAFLRAQRTRRGVHHDQGAVLRQFKEGNKLNIERLLGAEGGESFERRWLYYGDRWEEDLSLLS